MKNTFTLLCLCILHSAFCHQAIAQGTAFTYQGRLTEGGNSAIGSYDLRFALFDAATVGSQLGAAVTNQNVAVSNGLFTVLLDFGGGVFTNEARWLEIGVRPGGSVQNFTTLAPRQATTPTPYALFAAQAGNNTPGPQGPPGPPGSADAWSRTGNSGTTAGIHFLGTTDNQPLEVRVNGLRAVRLEPNTESPVLIGGSIGNYVAAGTPGAVIGGGGTLDDGSGAAHINAVTAPYGTVAGGLGNSIAGYAGTVGGGYTNRIGTDALFTTIAGGRQNLIETNASFSTLGGGRENQILSASGYSTISGGLNNTIQNGADWGTIPGGRSNTVSGSYSLAAGRRAQAANPGAFVWADSTDDDFKSTRSNQFSVRASGGVRFETTGAGATVDGQTVLTGTIGTAQLTDNAVTTAKLADLSVTTPKLADLAVTTAKLADGAVTAAKLGASSVGASALANGAVTAGKIAAGAVGASQLAADSVFSTKIVDGSVIAADLDAASFATTFWKADGNAGTTPGTHFLGTTDNQALELKVNNVRALRLEPGNSPTLVGGYSGNLSGGWGAGTIAGGGSLNLVNRLGGAYATVGGGGDNQAMDYGATVAGGLGNLATNTYATVSGGHQNSADGQGATVGGGIENTSSADYATVSGGLQNLSSGQDATVGGGAFNSSSGPAATVGGGIANLSSGQNATVGGGLGNTNNAAWATVGGGWNNTIVASSTYATVAGGNLNRVHTNSVYSVIGGGFYSLVANSSFATIAGGHANGIGNNADNSTIGGGYGNGILDAESSTIGGGENNSIYTADHSTIGGGGGNVVNGQYATIPGGAGNSADGDYSFAAGSGANADHNGAFVWADSSGGDVVSTNADSVTMRASGGYRLFSDSAQRGGVFLAPNGNSWAAISDRNAKKNFAPVDERGVLEKLTRVPIQRWNYKWEPDDAVPHVGPMAQDFKAAFYPGRDDKSITTQEVDGVALAAIQGLNQKVEEQRAELRERDAKISALEQRLAALERLLSTSHQH